MPVVTRTELENAQVDAAALASFANSGPAVTVALRLGGTVPSLQKFLADSSAALVEAADGAIPMLLDYTALRAYGGALGIIILYDLTIAGVFVLDASDSTTADNGGTVIVDATSRRWKRQHEGNEVHARWWGASPDATGTVNAAAISDALTYVKDTFGGGKVILALGQFEVDADVVSIQENCGLKGGTPAAGYDNNYWGEGTELVIVGDASALTPADFGIILEVRQARLENVFISPKAATFTTYGLVESGAAHNVENVSIKDFPYNHVLGGANSNVHRNVLRLAATKVNFAILPQKSGDVVGRCYPQIESRIPAVASTIFTMYNCRCRSGFVNWAFLDGLGGRLIDCVSESSVGHGVVAFKRSNLAKIEFQNFYQENDHTGTAAAGDYDDIELFDTASGILYGDVSGAWNHTNDGNTGWFIGSAVESYSSGGYNYAGSGGGPSHWKWFGGTLMCRLYVFRMRSARWPVLERATISSQTTSSAVFLNTTQNCYGMELNDIDSLNLTDDVKNMTVGGRNTTYRQSEARLQGSSMALATATPVNIVADVTLMSPGNEYEYRIGANGGPHSNFSEYGTFIYDGGGGATPHIMPVFSGAQSSVAFSGNALQYTQTSGGPKDIFWKITCKGRAELL